MIKKTPIITVYTVNLFLINLNHQLMQIEGKTTIQNIFFVKLNFLKILCITVMYVLAMKVLA